MNSSDMMAVVAALLLLLSPFAITALVFPSFKWFVKFEKLYRENVIIVLLYLTYMKFMFTAMLNFVFFDVFNAEEAGNSLAAWGFVVVAICFPVFHTVHSFFFRKEVHDYRKSLQETEENKVTQFKSPFQAEGGDGEELLLDK